MTIPEDDRTILSPAEVAGELVEEWRYLHGGLHARYETGDFATALALVDRVGALAEDANHHPDVDLRYGSVTLRLLSHDVGGVTQRDVRLAREITAAAGRVGATARPEHLRVLEWGLDTRAHPEIAPFWAAVLGLRHEDGADDAADPDGRVAGLWFQEAPDAAGTAETAAEVPQRWHPDVWVPLEAAERRIAEAVAAGGTTIDDAAAPGFWVLADPHGNRACICTVAGRSMGS